MGTSPQIASALVAVALVAAGGVGGCAISDPYRVDDSGSTKESPAALADTNDASAAGDASAPSAASAATTTQAAALTDAGTPAGPCEPQLATWTVGSSSCTALSDHLELGATETLKDSTPDDTGSVTVACVDGKLTYSGAICEPPKVFDVSSPAGCANGYCSAVVGGHCGMPDPAKATAFCVFKGYADETAFTTGPGPNGVRQCSPDGSSCFVNANPSCNIVFTSVTCRH